MYRVWGEECICCNHAPPPTFDDRKLGVKSQGEDLYGWCKISFEQLSGLSGKTGVQRPIWHNSYNVFLTRACVQVVLRTGYAKIRLYITCLITCTTVNQTGWVKDDFLRNKIKLTNNDFIFHANRQAPKE